MRLEVDEEFAQYVRARQHRLLRGAWLVCGDSQVAEGVVHAALVKLALRWDKLRGDEPHSFVRRVLYRDAVSAWRRARRESLSPFPEPDHSAKQRAVLVLRYFEDLGEVETAELLGVSTGTVRSQTSPSPDGELAARLERSSEHLPELDFAGDAWAGAIAALRHQRRVWLGSLGAVAAAALAVVAVQLNGSTTHPPIPAPTSATTPVVRTFADGAAYALMPMEGQEAQLRHFDAGIPSVLDLQAKADAMSSLTRPFSPVVAVYLTDAGAGRFHPVLVTNQGQQVVVDRLTLHPTADASGNPGSVLGPRAVGGGGRYVVFAQPGQVVRLDTHTGAVTNYPVPSQTLTSAGWNAAGSVVIARDEHSAWAIDASMPGASAVATSGAYEGTFRLAAASDSVGVTRFGTDGKPVATSTVKAPVTGTWGETINSDTWAAAGALFDQNVTHPVIRLDNGPIYQGLVAVNMEAGAARLLLAPESPDGQTGRFNGCCTALGWADGQNLLFESVGSHGRWVLDWNITTGEVFEVSQLFAAVDARPVVPLALNVGWRY
ncbi:MAG TPA: sigma factor-like helix-turn-helix DNA-binding protein [Pedococcus sp.]|nr:sigma factor-like helix-turn-helix DNA-binding protein [Pedococcus sp.]